MYEKIAIRAINKGKDRREILADFTGNPEYK